RPRPRTMPQATRAAVAETLMNIGVSPFAFRYFTCRLEGIGNCKGRKIAIGREVCIAAAEIVRVGDTDAPGRLVVGREPERHLLAVVDMRIHHRIVERGACDVVAKGDAGVDDPGRTE